MKNRPRISARTRLLSGGALLAAFVLCAASTLRAQGDDAAAPTSAYHQAFLNYKGGNYDAARLAIDDAEKENPGNPNTAILKARILTELGDYDGARRALDSLNDNPRLTPADGDNRTLAYADLCLRKRSFDEASKFYESLLGSSRPGDPDIELKLIYARVSAGDMVTAMKYASALKPMDPVNPAYYFAKAALAESNGRSAEADQDIQTVRTIYGISVANRYLKTYLHVFSAAPKGGVSARAEPPSTNAAPPAPGQP